ncbi:MAG: ribbon-helix-helix domain-containing protein [Rhodospirillales bacterium]|nr:ribbon-helix-helix domain-containing protein [Alphaproteobacteria bacterium]MCB9986118.1 ribbon-helix-helix domain-containing protein [Rhodospirillales bacterium]USO07322.1 MAG: ribbon-helix-helix domain-containing protein [Rhodospirillales bacterium]
MKKRSVTLKGHRTSVSLEPEFWAVLEELAARRGQSLQKLVEGVDQVRGIRSLAAALRVLALAEK